MRLLQTWAGEFLTERNALRKAKNERFPDVGP